MKIESDNPWNALPSKYYERVCLTPFLNTAKKLNVNNGVFLLSTETNIARVTSLLF